MVRMIWAVVFTCLCTSLAAQEVSECDWRSHAVSVVEPWEENTRTFANGAVRLALLDTIEPAAGAYHLLILSPPYDEVGGRSCATVGFGGGMGFAGLYFQAIETEYDPEVGLVFGTKVAYFEDAEFVTQLLLVTLNQTTGEIEAWLE